MPFGAGTQLVSLSAGVLKCGLFSHFWRALTYGFAAGAMLRMAAFASLPLAFLTYIVLPLTRA
jgi:hypothetical protein